MVWYGLDSMALLLPCTFKALIGVLDSGVLGGNGFVGDRSNSFFVVKYVYLLVRYIHGVKVLVWSWW